MRRKGGSGNRSNIEAPQIHQPCSRTGPGNPVPESSFLLFWNPRSEALSSVLFKSITYRLMNKVETFISCPVGIPDLPEADKFLEFVKNEMDKGFPVFTFVHQNMGWERYMQTLRFC